MAKGHLSTEMMADLLSGRIEDDDLRRRVVPHLLDGCAVCRERSEEVRRMQVLYDHPDESVAFHEGREAPHLLAALMAHPEQERLNRVHDDEAFHTWGLCQLLLRRSHAATFEDASDSVEFAELALAITEHLVPAYDPTWIQELTARAWAHLGNARRVLGELRSADGDLRRAWGLFTRIGTGRPEVEAELLDLTASLRREQRRFPEALELLERSAELVRAVDDAHRLGRVLIKKATILEGKGKVAEAIELLGQAPRLLDPERDPRLPLYARHNLLCCLITADRHAEAHQLLPEMRKLFERTATAVDHARLRWAEGRIAHGMGKGEEAEAIYRAVREEMLEHELGLDAALVSLDLALLFAENGRHDDLEELSTGLVGLFRSQEIHREALAALYLVQQAVERRVVTAEFIREMAELLRQETRRC